jgi:hypothetical protein
MTKCRRSGSDITHRSRVYRYAHCVTWK